MKTLFLALEDFRSRDRGSRIRDWYTVEALATLGDVTVLCFSPDHTSDSYFDLEAVEFLVDSPTKGTSAMTRAALHNTMYHVERYDFTHHSDVDSVRGRSFDLIVASQIYPMAHLDAVAGARGSRPPVMWDTHNFDPDVWDTKASVGSTSSKAFARAMRRRASALVDTSIPLADVIVACTEADGALWAQSAPETRVVVAVNAADLAQWEECRNTPGNPNLFVLFGSLNQDSTQAGALWFLEHVWPAYSEAHTDARLIIAGREPQQNLVTMSDSADSVDLIANPADLVPIVARAATVVVPQVWGTGSKLKLAEALASGRRIVASPSAVVGTPGALRGAVDVVDSVSEWVGAMARASENPRTDDEMASLVALMSDSLSWSVSQEHIIAAAKEATSR